MLEWLDIEWFLPQTFWNFEYQNAWVWWVMPFALASIWWVFYSGKTGLSFAFSSRKMPAKGLYWRFLPPVIYTFALFFLLVALARPIRIDKKRQHQTEGIDIVLTLDISPSMSYLDFTPNRLHVAKKVCLDFIAGRSQDRIGTVIFSGEALVAAPLTTDYQLLHQVLAQVHFGDIPVQGTAIGDALISSTALLENSSAKSKVIILISDGDNTAGNTDPISAANLASNSYGIKMYAILIGKEGKVPVGEDFFGQMQYTENTIDEKTLQEIAQIGKGLYFRAEDEKALNQVFDQIDQLERVEIESNARTFPSDFYTNYIVWGAILWIAALFLRSSFIANGLED